MDFDLQALLDAFWAMPLWEIVAVILGLIYVIGAAKEAAWCWVAGFFGTLIYTVLFWQGKLYFSAALNLFYMGMAMYGFMLWRRGESKEDNALTVSRWPIHKHLIAVLTTALLGLALAYFLADMLDARKPYLDASVTVFSMLATWMLARKIIETWIYWVAIDSAALTLYWSTGYYPTIFLFTVYIFLSVYGYLSWRKSHTEVLDG